MTVAIAVVLAVLIVSFVLFATGWLKPDLIAMLVLVALVLTGTVAPADAFAGFSSFAVIAVAGLMVVGEGLKRTGVVKWVARQLARVIRRSYGRLLLLNSIVPAVLAGFLTVLAAASFFVPVILRLCKQMEVPSSKILLPMASMAMIGANLTLIGASHNLVVDSILRAGTGEGFAFFEFTAVGAVLLAAAVAYTFAVGQHLLPGREVAPDPTDVPVSVDLARVYGLSDRLSELWVAPSEERDAEQTVASLGIERAGLSLIALVRGSEQLILPRPETRLEGDDMLLVVGGEAAVERLAEGNPTLTYMGPPEAQKAYPLSTAELAEAVVPPRSPAVGTRVRDLGLTEKFGMTAIAWYRDGTPHRTGVQDTVLREGDSLLVYGPREKMREFEPEKDLLIYHRPGLPDVSTAQKRLAPVAAAILAAVVLGAALGFMPIAAMAVAGAVAMVLAGIVPLAEVYRSIEWRTLVLIAGMYPLGIGLNGTGAADLIGEALIAAVGGFGPLAVLAGVSVLAMVLTQPMHNAAVAIIMTPIALNAAAQIGADPRAFAVAVLVACSASFLMPYGHPAPLMVQHPAGYRDRDYAVFGAGLTLIALAVILLLVPALWPL